MNPQKDSKNMHWSREMEFLKLDSLRDFIETVLIITETTSRTLEKLYQVNQIFNG